MRAPFLVTLRVPLRALSLATLALGSVVACSSKEESTGTSGAGGMMPSAGSNAVGGAGAASGGQAGATSGGKAGTGGTGGAATGGVSAGGMGIAAGSNAIGGAGAGGGKAGAGGAGTAGAATGGAGAAGASAGTPSSGMGGEAGLAGAPSGTLALYFVDTEGGQATVISFPDGEVLVVDTGNSGSRDADRIQVVLAELGKSSVDYLITTHYHGDHVGGATTLNDRTPVSNFLDHGDEEAPQSYLTMANAGTRRIVAPGDTLDVGAAHLDFVCSAGNLITDPLPGGAANPFCDGVARKGESDENENSVGFVLRFGAFDFVDLGDLLWDWELDLACPTNLLGQVDLYLTTHHGLTRSGAPPLVMAMEPLAAVMNNGPRKGGGGSTWETLAEVPGGTNVWQLHQALDAPESENAPADQIANLGDGTADMGFFLKVTVQANGQFTISNPRTGASRGYQAR